MIGGFTFPTFCPRVLLEILRNTPLKCKFRKPVYGKIILCSRCIVDPSCSDGMAVVYKILWKGHKRWEADRIHAGIPPSPRLPAGRRGRAGAGGGGLDGVGIQHLLDQTRILFLLIKQSYSNNARLISPSPIK